MIKRAFDPALHSWKVFHGCAETYGYITRREDV